MPRTFSGLFEDIFNNGFQKMAGEDYFNHRVAPVNIHETDTAYVLHLMAPGLNKEDFKISTDKNLLQVSFEKKEAEQDQTGKWLRKEFKQRSFSRSFTMNDKINTSGITASYKDGILTINLPKKEDTETTSHEIAVN